MTEIEAAAEMRNRRIDDELRKVETWGPIHIVNHDDRPSGLCPLCQL